MRRTLLLSTGTALGGSLLTITTILVGVIPSWTLFNVAVPVCVAIASLVIIVVAHRRMHRDEVLEDWQFFGSCFLMLLYMVIVVASWYLSMFVRAFGPYPERSYTFEGPRQTVYMFEFSCFPPDSRAECEEYWTEVRTPIGFLPFTRTIVHCKCFYGEPVATSETSRFEVSDTYVPDTPPIVIDRRTMRLMEHNGTMRVR